MNFGKVKAVFFILVFFLVLALVVNAALGLDAKKHPENYRNLIVRVWGWSGYFVELDECYQDHIIKRMELSV